MTLMTEPIIEIAQRVATTLDVRLGRDLTPLIQALEAERTRADELQRRLFQEQGHGYEAGQRAEAAERLAAERAGLVERYGEALKECYRVALHLQDKGTTQKRAISQIVTIVDIALEEAVATASPVPDAIVERLAEYAHAAWSGWMEYLFRKSFPRDDGFVVIPRPLVERWTWQMETPYSELPENEKESDRDEARKMLAIIEAPAASPSRGPQYVEHVHCSACGKRVSGIDPEMGLVVRAYVECPECLERTANVRFPQ